MAVCASVEDWARLAMLYTPCRFMAQAPSKATGPTENHDRSTSSRGGTTKRSCAITEILLRKSPHSNGLLRRMAVCASVRDWARLAMLFTPCRFMAQAPSKATGPTENHDRSTSSRGGTTKRSCANAEILLRKSPLFQRIASADGRLCICSGLGTPRNAVHTHCLLLPKTFLESLPFSNRLLRRMAVCASVRDWARLAMLYTPSGFYMRIPSDETPLRCFAVELNRFVIVRRGLATSCRWFCRLSKSLCNSTPRPCNALPMVFQAQQIAM